MTDLKKENAELRQRLEKAEAERDELISKCLNKKVVDLVRCGIGGNYGGIFYDEAMNNYFVPIEQLRKELER